MVHPQDAHVGAPPGAALLDVLGGLVVHLHERHRAGRHAPGAPHHVVFGPQPGERKPRAPAGLVDERLVFQRIVDSRDRVLDRQDETGGQLLQRPAGVHEGRRIRQKVQAGRHGVKLFLGRAHCLWRCAVEGIRLHQVVRDTAKHPFRRFDHLAVLVLRQVPLLQNTHRVRRDAEGHFSLHSRLNLRRARVSSSFHERSSSCTTTN